MQHGNSKKRSIEDEESGGEALNQFNPLESTEEVEMISEVYNEYSDTSTSLKGVSGIQVKEILTYNWFKENLKLKVLWETEQISWEDLEDMKEDYPQLTARFILEN